MAGGRQGTRDLCGRTSRRRLALPHNFGAWPARAFLVPLQATCALATISGSCASAIADSSSTRFFLVSSFGSVEVLGALHVERTRPPGPAAGPSPWWLITVDHPLVDLPLVDHPLATRCSASFGRLQRRNRQPLGGGAPPRGRARRWSRPKLAEHLVAKGWSTRGRSTRG